MKKFTQMWIAALVLGVGLMISMPNANAQQDNKENAPNYKLVNMAMDLADYGYDNQSALALAQAAEILADNPVKSVNGKKAETNEPLPAVPGAHDYSPKALLDAARKYAGKDEATLAYIDKVEKSASASATRGSSKATAEYLDIRVAGGDYEYFYIDISGGCNIDVWITDSDASLCLYVYNLFDDLKDSDCRTNPSTNSSYLFSQKLKVKVVNKSSHSTYCRLWFDGICL